eukprot:m.95094 g.95094  ORF g.95094 m.95094 type:complete len:442 (-) comp15438_c0_seq6:203-1528(-)
MKTASFPATHLTMSNRSKRHTTRPPATRASPSSAATCVPPWSSGRPPTPTTSSSEQALRIGSLVSATWRPSLPPPRRQPLLLLLLLPTMTLVLSAPTKAKQAMRTSIWARARVRTRTLMITRRATMMSMMSMMTRTTKSGGGRPRSDGARGPKTALLPSMPGGALAQSHQECQQQQREQHKRQKLQRGQQRQQQREQQQQHTQGLHAGLGWAVAAAGDGGVARRGGAERVAGRLGQPVRDGAAAGGRGQRRAAERPARRRGGARRRAFLAAGDGRCASRKRRRWRTEEDGGRHALQHHHAAAQQRRDAAAQHRRHAPPAAGLGPGQRALPAPAGADPGRALLQHEGRPHRGPHRRPGGSCRLRRCRRVCRAQEARRRRRPCPLPLGAADDGRQPGCGRRVKRGHSVCVCIESVGGCVVSGFCASNPSPLLFPFLAFQNVVA